MALSPRLRERVKELLSNPDLFPDEFKSWLIRYLNGNKNLSLQSSQLEDLEQRIEVAVGDGPVFENSAVNYDPTNIERASFYADMFGRVYLAGLMKDGTNNTAWFTLPAGYRPRKVEQFRIDMFRGGAYVMGRVDVYPDGRVIPIALEGAGTLGYVSISGISFRSSLT